MSTVTERIIDGSEEEYELRRGPWTLEEDTLLIHYIACHGEGLWNSLAKLAGCSVLTIFSGLKRNGKSCRLRWLNYLKPDIKRGNLTPQEQLLILELHSKWGNRWSKIARQLPGRTDNEIKNYWRTRVQKQARQLRTESTSKRFLESIRCFWMPRLLEQMDQTSSSSSTPPPPPSAMETDLNSAITSLLPGPRAPVALPSPQPSKKWEGIDRPTEKPSLVTSSDSMRVTQLPETSEHPEGAHHTSLLNDSYYVDMISVYDDDSQVAGSDWINNDGMAASLWNIDELWYI